MVLKAVQNFQPDRGIQQKVRALQAQIDKTVSSLLSAADRHKKRGNLRARRTALQKVLVLSPSHPNALAGLRELTSEEAHAAQNSKAQAEQTAAAKSASASVLGQIQSLIEGGQYRAALSQLGEPSATQSQSAAHTQLQYSALMGLAAEAEQKQQSDEAWQLYARASALNGINTAAAATKSQSLGDVLSKEHQAAGERALRTDPGSAVDHFQAALRYNPNNNRARRGLGQAQRMRDRLEQLRNR